MTAKTRRRSNSVLSDGAFASAELINLARARRIIKRGGRFQILLDGNASDSEPVWRVVVFDASGRIFTLISSTTNSPRSLRSVQQVYRAASNLGANSVTVPIVR